MVCCSAFSVGVAYVILVASSVFIVYGICVAYVAYVDYVVSLAECCCRCSLFLMFVPVLWYLCGVRCLC